VGHSERRTGFGFSGEPDAVVAKVKTAITGGIDVIACVGEQLSERETTPTAHTYVKYVTIGRDRRRGANRVPGRHLSGPTDTVVDH